MKGIKIAKVTYSVAIWYSLHLFFKKTYNESVSPFILHFLSK